MNNAAEYVTPFNLFLWFLVIGVVIIVCCGALIDYRISESPTASYISREIPLMPMGCVEMFDGRAAWKEKK